LSTANRKPMSEQGDPDQPLATRPEQTDLSDDVPLVRAAGAVLWRTGDNDRTEVAVVHRPRYDDWSLPKGKLDHGENAPLAAAREVAEETGFSCVLSRFLQRVHYPIKASDGGRARKQVDYFAAYARSGSFTPNEEVDELRWLDIDEAANRLTYPHDARVLEVFSGLPTGVTTLLLVRHAKAGARADWSGDDNQRPLSDAGLRQQAALRGLLPLFAPERAYSAPRLRCEQTIAPVAEDLGLTIGMEPQLSEEGYWPNPAAGVDRLLRIASEPGTALVCSQGGVIPDLVTRLAESGGMTLREVASKKGSLWTLTFLPDNAQPRLAAADYLPDALA
jgi:8-oxo-dGTP pyrophosphatase MutT (NUDIX family)/phosphohistidine phosphatase SixA